MKPKRKMILPPGYPAAGFRGEFARWWGTRHGYIIVAGIFTDRRQSSYPMGMGKVGWVDVYYRFKTAIWDEFDLEHGD